MSTLRIAEINKDLSPPHYHQIRRSYTPIRTDPKYKKGQDQKDFDRRIFQALMVGGVGDNSIPTSGKEMLALIVGGIRIVCCGDVITPGSVHFDRKPDALWKLWALSWEALNVANPICATIRKSLERLLVPTSEKESYGNESNHYNRLLADLWEYPTGIWWNASYYIARQSTSHLDERIRKEGTGLDSFSRTEQKSLKLLIDGVAQTVALYNEESKGR